MCEHVSERTDVFRAIRWRVSKQLCLFVQDQAKAMDHFDERVKALQDRSLQVLPLKYRRSPPQKLLPIEALCDYDTDEVLNTSPPRAVSNASYQQLLEDSNGKRVTQTLFFPLLSE